MWRANQILYSDMLVWQFLWTGVSGMGAPSTEGSRAATRITGCQNWPATNEGIGMFQSSFAKPDGACFGFGRTPSTNPKRLQEELIRC